MRMNPSRCDQNSAAPIDTFQRFTHFHPMHSENNHVALGCLLPGPCDGTWTEIGDKISQCRRASGIGYNYGVTSLYQMEAERRVTLPAPIKPIFITTSHTKNELISSQDKRERSRPILEAKKSANNVKSNPTGANGRPVIGRALR